MASNFLSACLESCEGHNHTPPVNMTPLRGDSCNTSISQVIKFLFSSQKRRMFLELR